jgi:hypothetical protein
VHEQSQPGTIVETTLPHLRQVEWREWWLWGFAVAVTLVLTLESFR